MIQQMQSQCGECRGRGEIVPPGRRCRKCNGKKVFHGEGEQQPGTLPGNVVVILQEERHPDFRREGNNLFIKRRLSLQESLCGFKFVFTHLDDRKCLVTSEPGKIYSHGDIKSIPEEGLLDTYGRGNLYVEFEVEFQRPDYFSEEQKRRLRSLLPKVEPLKIDRSKEDVDEVVLIEVDIAAEKRKFSTQKA